MGGGGERENKTWAEVCSGQITCPQPHSKGANPQRVDRVDGLVRAFCFRLSADGRYSGREIPNDV